MAGDDAVEFFESFGREFQVNLEDLHIWWNLHFGPEGGPSLGFVAETVTCMIAGFFLRDLLGILPAWGWGLVLIVAAVIVHKRWFADRTIPITISDLIEAARSGRWSKTYNWNDVKSQLRIGS